ncbi:hypothetical protein KOR42_09320 [Thalassoglobus neptunius]|uniref:DUF4404 domain-containing protein n=1 Tax=Thalassoglobus neptunius TaxID=1938619 RepID=A0A5C5X3Y5_9PLAN|nr:DUF4404 family protein [Thalassoglobus neptunius]TWT57570.1 hypothetical protein KOR42_09320 [Thalassoglobus neptunius]
MERKQLIETLNELHQELANSQEDVDPETQALLKQLSSDIDRICVTESAEQPEPVSSSKQESMIDQLLGLTDEFEESHPRLAEIVGRVASALSRIGI